MRVFVFDDDAERHFNFAKNLRGHDSVHVETFDDAVRVLQEADRFDVFFLDHDLNHFGKRSIGPSDSMYGGVRELTGADFAQFIARELPEEKWPDCIIIHSWNDPGALNMASHLKPTGIPIQIRRWDKHLGKQIG